MSNFLGTPGPDSWTGTSADEFAQGGGGNDQLNGGGGNDQISGDDGNDIIEGGPGIDQLHGGAGDDVFIYGLPSDYAAGEVIDGGSGFDIVRYTSGPVTLNLSGATLTGIEGIDAGSNVPAIALTAAQLDALTAVSGAFTLTTAGSVSMAGVVSAAPGGAVPVFVQFRLAAADNSFDMRGCDTPGAGVVGNDGKDLVYGTAGDDVLLGFGGDDILFGNDGSDQLDGGAGRDEVHGGTGDDILRMLNPGDLVAGDILDGGDGFDRIAFDGVGQTYDFAAIDLGTIEGLGTGSATARLTVAQFGALKETNGNFVFTDAGSLSLNGIASTAFTNQQFTLADGANRLDLKGFAGFIRVNGGAGADTVIGDATAVTLLGGGGNDILYASTAGGFLDGGTGDDRLYAGNKLSNGTNTLNGGDGNDGVYVGSTFGGFDSADGGAGTDTFVVQGNYANLALGRVDNFEVLLVASGKDASFGDNAGNLYSYHVTSVDSNIAAGGQLTVIATDLRAGESLAFDGSAETDGNFRIFAGQGVDTLTGGGGGDGFFFGADGNLTADDRVVGGGGVDSLALRGNYAGANAVHLVDASFTGVETLVFLSGHTNEYGGPISQSGFDYDLTLADGNVAAGQRLDVIGTTLAADESLRFDGRAETDGSFRILSGAGDDTLYGGNGNDIIWGALGADTIDGGAGADTYLYRSTAESTATSRDTITFGAGDKIDLSSIDAIAGGGNDAFAFVGANPFSHNAGELRAVDAGGGQWLVEADINGDGLADFSLAVNTATPLAAGDFVL